ncbi:MAG: hypothetical protein ACE5IZ_06175, partial [Dehalococcoidia bacterium]
MRDWRDLPIGEALIVVLAAALAATFAGVFIMKGGGGEASEGVVVAPAPTPTATPVATPGG